MVPNATVTTDFVSIRDSGVHSRKELLVAQCHTAGEEALSAIEVTEEMVREQNRRKKKHKVACNYFTSEL